jgi:hypothetical protein
MADALARSHRRLSFGRLWKYGIVAFVSLVTGYLIHFYSLPPCLLETEEEHFSPNYTFTVKEYTTCYYSSIRIINNKHRKITPLGVINEPSIDYAAVNQNSPLQQVVLLPLCYEVRQVGE